MNAGRQIRKALTEIMCIMGVLIALTIAGVWLVDQLTPYAPLSQVYADADQHEKLAVHAVNGQTNGIPNKSMDFTASVRSDGCFEYNPELARKYLGDSNDFRTICFERYAKNYGSMNGRVIISKEAE